MASTEKMNWYAVRTQNNKEKSVLEKLKTEVNYNKLNDVLGQTIIPTEKVISVRNGKKFFKDKIIYPGYLFVETSATGEINNILKTINGASGFVRTRSGEIQPMKPYEVSKILIEQEDTNAKDYSNIFAMNEEVKIIDGPFSSFKGKISFLDQEREKVRIEVSIFGRPTMVDLNLLQIEKMS